MEELMSTFAGIDWGAAFHQLAVVDDSGRELSNARFAHTREGVTDLIGTLDDQSDLVGVAIERSDGIIVDQLHEHDMAVFPVSPRVSARARERHQAAARKSDRFDAFVLADTLRTDGWRWRPLAKPSALHAELRQVVRHRRQTVETQLMVESQLRETLLAYHPGVVALFSSVDRDATLAFLRDYPTPRAAAHVGEARMAGFCKRIGYTGRVPASLLVERLRTHLLSASDGNVEGHRYAALVLADQLELLNNQLRSFNGRIQVLLDAHPDREIFTSFPATGRVTAAELLAEIGEDRARFPTVQVLLAEAGAAPVTLASGKVKRVRIRYACNHRLRATSTSWAHVLKRIDPISRARYLAAMERGATYHGALRAVAATWLRVLWRCWQDNSTYDTNRHRPT
jgi:transposase